ncbi:MAG: hypothetical protein WCW33_00970 [Candidatus Babeliales bacterium]|jgi:hypothetical protein
MKYGTRTAKLLFGVALAASLCMPYAKAEKIPWVWGLGGGKVYYREGITKEKPGGETWKLVALTNPAWEAISIAASAVGTLWVVVRGGLVSRDGITPQTPMGTSWSSVSLAFEIFNIAVGNFDQVYAIRYPNCEEGYRKSLAWTYKRVGITRETPTGTGWAGIQNSATRRAIGTFKNSVANPTRLVAMGDNVYGLSNHFAKYGLSHNDINETIYKLNQEKTQWLDVFGGRKDRLAVDKRGYVWAIDYKDNKLWASPPSQPGVALQWRGIDQNVNYVACGPTGEVWALLPNQIKRRVGITDETPFGTGWEDVEPINDQNVQLALLAIGAIEAPPVEEKPAAPAPVVSPAVSPAATEVKKVKKDTKSAAKKTAVKKPVKKSAAAKK